MLSVQADNIVQASLGITVRACFNLTVAVMGKNNTPLTVAKTGTAGLLNMHQGNSTQ